MNNYRFRKSKLPAVLAAILILATVAAAFVFVPKLINQNSNNNASGDTLLPSQNAEKSPALTATPTPTVRPAYIPILEELTAIPEYDKIQFTKQFEKTEYNEQGALSVEWQPVSGIDYYVLCVTDDDNNIIRKEILWPDTSDWDFAAFEGTGLMLLAYKDMGQDSMEDDLIAEAFSAKIEPFYSEPSESKDYKIIVDKEDCTFAIFEFEQKSGDFTKLIDQFPCALGGPATPSGTFKIGDKGQWKRWTDEQYSPYHARFARRKTGGGLYFHGPVYTVKKRFDTLATGSYDGIGKSKATHGCIRTTVAGAKWIYDYCKAGTIVEIVSSTDLVTKVIRPERDRNFPRWDPTDPNKPVK